MIYAITNLAKEQNRQTM